MSDLDEAVEAMQRQIIEQALREYSAIVVEHWTHPRNQYAMDNPDGYARIKGPCGDTMEFFLRVQNGKIADASFLTDGCITSISSGSMAVELTVGKSLAEARAVSAENILNELGGLPEESQHCAVLASDTLRAAVGDYMISEKEPWKRLYNTGPRR